MQPLTLPRPTRLIQHGIDTFDHHTDSSLILNPELT